MTTDRIDSSIKINYECSVGIYIARHGLLNVLIDFKKGENPQFVAGASIFKLLLSSTF